MSDTDKNRNLSLEEVEAKGKVLAAVLTKHNPNEMRDLAFEKMQTAEKGSEEFRCYAALYEIMDIFK